MNDEQGRKVSDVFFGVVIAGLLWILGVSVAFANMVVRDQAGNSMTLYDKPCADGKVLAFIAMKGGKTDQFRAGLLNYEKKDYSACWMAAPDGYVYVVDDSGDISKIPMSAFVRVTGV
jgi:hypothetical protein